MKDGKIQEIRSGSDFGGSVRVLKNGSWGFAFTTQLSRLDEMAESALKLANSTKSDVELVKVETSNDNVKSKAKLLPSKVSLDEKKEVMQDAESAANIDKGCKHNRKLR